MGKKGGGDDAAAQARADEQARQARIREGTARIDDIFKKNFTPEFYDARSKAFEDYASPQLGQQYDDAQKQLTYALARSGTLDSSIRGDKAAELQRLHDIQLQGVRDQALSYKTDAMNKVEGARGDLVQMVNVTGDAEGAASSAIARSTALSQPQAFSPLGQLFSTFTAGLGQQAALEKAAAYSGGLVTPKYNTGLFSPSGAVKVT